MAAERQLPPIARKVQELLSESSAKAKELGLGPTGEPRTRLPNNSGLWWMEYRGETPDTQWEDLFWGSLVIREDKVQHELEKGEL